jgi:glycosyltransferase involved in cell wall biosynthesis
MKLWLASYPRSGNTYFRDILFACYGIESSTFHIENDINIEPDFARCEIVKTHLLPEQLDKEFAQLPSVYLIRDGRDSMVSMAHHKKDLINPGTDFLENLEEIIIAANGTHFSGWSTNVEKWIKHADIIIRYEDLIKDPIKEIEKIRKIYPLPQPDVSKLPTFESQKLGKSQYAGESIQNMIQGDAINIAQKNIRKGKAGSWKEEMPEYYHDLCWNYHGQIMEKLGYQYDGQLSEIDAVFYQKIKIKMDAHCLPKTVTNTMLIDATKILGHTNDGVKRYVIELLRQLKEMQAWGDESLHFHIHVNGRIYDINELELFINLIMNNKDLYLYERVLLGIRACIKLVLSEDMYDKLSPIYRNSGWRKKILVLKKNMMLLGERLSRNIMLTKAVNKKRPDEPLNHYSLIHITLPQHIAHFKNKDIPKVVTIHDISHKLFQEFHLEINVDRAELGLQEIKNNNMEVISISQSTSNDLKTHYGIEETTIIPEAANSDLFRVNTNQHLFKSTLQKYNLPLNRKYFLSLGTLEPRKNIVNLIKAFQKIQNTDICLFVVGKKGWQYDEIIASGKNTNNIYFTGYVSDEDLPVLYTGAHAFCYVSHYEGFGLPLLEAMSCRIPVICGNNSSQIELIDNNGIALDANDVEAISHAMSIMLDNEVREKYAVQAWKKSFEYTWYKTAKLTVNCYQEIIKNKHTASQ